MVRERIQEVVDFATSESPYRSANKGWITDDIYLQVGASPQGMSTGGDELADVSIFWQPINKLLLILLGVFALATIFVVTSISLSHGEGFDSSAQTASVMTKLEPAAEQTQSDSMELPPTNKPLASEIVKINPPLPAADELPRKVPSITQADSEKVSRELKITTTSLGEVSGIPKPKPTTAVDLFQPKHL